MKLNFQSTVNLLRKFSLGKNMSSSESADKKKSDACNVQSDLNLHCSHKVIMLCLAVQGLVHPKLNDVLSDLWWYYEWKKVTILARKKTNRSKVSVYVFL